MEEKLAQYRAQKAKEYEKQKSDSKTAAEKGWQFFKGLRNKSEKDEGKPDNTEEKEKSKECAETEPLVYDSCERLGDQTTESRNRNICWNPTLWKFVLWTVLWGLFLELGFGAVYFVVSVSVILYLSMRSGSRSASEPSAYSVFNPNCERIDGTFTAEQFERELRFGPASVHQ